MKDTEPSMPYLLVRSFASLLLAFQPCFTQPSFSSFWAVTCAWILCSGRRSLTRVIQSGQLGQFKHFCSFHRFFSQARWNLDDLGRCVFQLLLPFCDEILLAAVDDTLVRKSGRHIWGAGMHHDPLRSTAKRPFFAFGHNFVVFSLQVALPFAPDKYWAFPILVRMYRKRQTQQRAPGKGGKLGGKQTGQATAQQYRTRPELAAEMIQIVASWIPQRTLRVLGDSEYAGQSVSRHLPANAKLISRMNMKAALYEPAGKTAQRGRRRKKGHRLLSPLQMAQEPKAHWIKTTVRLYGKKVKLWYQTLDALWDPSAGQQLLRIVLVRDPSGRRHDDCFFSLDLTLPAADDVIFSPPLAPGGLLPRRQAISGLRRSPESRGPGHHAHRSPDLLYLRSGLTLVRAGGIPTDSEFSPRPLVVSAKGIDFF